MINSVIFDMGGVLLRTVDQTPREQMAMRFGCSRKELEDFVFLSPTSMKSEIGQLDDMDHWRVVLEHFNQTDISPLEAYYEYFSGDAIDQDLLDFARSLKNGIKIGLLSNAWENARQRLGSLYEFIGFFDISIFSAEVGMRKPEKGIYDLMLERMGAQAHEAVLIDDFLLNVRGAQDAGLHTIHFKSNDETIQGINCLLQSG